MNNNELDIEELYNINFNEAEDGRKDNVGNPARTKEDWSKPTELQVYAGCDPLPPEVYESIKHYTDSDITDEIINELKAMNYSKPPNITWPRWNVLNNPKIIHEHIVNMAVLGKSQKAIAQELGFNIERIKAILRSDKIKASIQAKMADLYQENIKKALNSRALKGLEVIDSIIDDNTARANVKLDAAKFLIEHSVGKPQQSIKHEGNLLAEVIAHAEQLRNVNDANNPKDNTPDPMDNLVDTLVPQGLVVGKRSTEGS